VAYANDAPVVTARVEICIARADVGARFGATTPTPRPIAGGDPWGGAKRVDQVIRQFKITRLLTARRRLMLILRRRCCCYCCCSTSQTSRRRTLLLPLIFKHELIVAPYYWPIYLLRTPAQSTDDK